MPSGKIKDIAYEGQDLPVYVLLEKEKGGEEPDSNTILAINPYTSETLASVDIPPLKGIWVEPVKRVLIGLEKGRREILLFSLTDLSLISTIHSEAKIKTLEVNPGGGTLVLVTEKVSGHSDCDHDSEDKAEDSQDRKSICTENCIEVVSIDDGSLQASHSFREKIEGISVDSGSATLAVLGKSGRVYLLDLLTMKETMVLEAGRHTKDILLSDGKVLVTSHKAGILSVFDTATGQVVESIPIGKRPEWISKAWPYYLVSYAEGVRVLREDLPPEIEAIEPGEVQAGAGDVALSVTGRWFVPGAEATCG